MPALAALFSRQNDSFRNRSEAQRKMYESIISAYESAEKKKVKAHELSRLSPEGIAFSPYSVTGCLGCYSEGKRFIALEERIFGISPVKI